MFKFIVKLTLGIVFTALMQIPAIAWEQHSLPASFSQSSTPHYGGSKAPLVLSATHIASEPHTATQANIFDPWQT